MRPFLYDVAAAATPPTMTILFPDPSPELAHREVTIRIRTPLASPDQARRVAADELARFTDAELELLRESATPLDRAKIGAVRYPGKPLSGMRITKATQESRYLGPIFCPLCCHRLGVGNSPAIGYTSSCPSCAAVLALTFAPNGTITIRAQRLP